MLHEPKEHTVYIGCDFDNANSIMAPNEHLDQTKLNPAPVMAEGNRTWGRPSCSWEIGGDLTPVTSYLTHGPFRGDEGGKLRLLN
jgi:hypothetical protein